MWKINVWTFDDSNIWLDLSVRIIIYHNYLRVARKKNINFLFISVDLEQTIVRQHMTWRKDFINIHPFWIYILFKLIFSCVYISGIKLWMKEEADEIVEYSRWEIDSCKYFFCFCVQKSHTVEVTNFSMLRELF